MIVDTHLKAILESPELYRAAKTVVVIDHHRKCVGHIDDSVVFYHEPYASSASELVSELLQYIDMTKENRLTPLEGAGAAGRHHAGHAQFLAAHGRAHVRGSRLLTAHGRADAGSEETVQFVV